MIKDKLENAQTYYGISEALKTGFEWLKRQDLLNIIPDKYIIEGNKLYANIQEYETKGDALFEAHKKYIDIQYMIKGREIVGVCDKKLCKPNIPYEEEKDIEFLDCAAKEEWQTLNEGEFLVLFPHDAHKPSITPKDNHGENNTVKKVVVKVLID